MQIDSLTPTEKNTETTAEYHCTKCKIGSMVKADFDSDPEYSDAYICNNCQHQTDISSRAIINSQAMTGIIGLIICCLLMTGSIIKVINALKLNNTQELWQHAGLTILSILFLTGFCFITLQAQKAYTKRKSYLPK